MSVEHAGRIFISYRREDTRHLAGRLTDRLMDHFAAANVFMDVDAIDPGTDFIAAIKRAVGECNVLVAIIGRHWVGHDSRGQRRLDDPQDFVRLEIASALERGVRVIPVLVDGASMPDAESLPEDLQALTYRQLVRIDHETFRSDSITLVDAVRKALNADAPKPSASNLIKENPVPAFAIGDIRTIRHAQPLSNRLFKAGLHTAFSPSGDKVASTGSGVTHLWKLPEASLQQILTRGKERWEPINSCTFSFDGRQIATCIRNKILLWDPSKGALIGELAHKGVQSVAYSPSGTWLLSGGGKSVKLWNMRSQSVHFDLAADEYVLRVTFNRDGRWFASTGVNHLRIWDADTGQVICNLGSHDDLNPTGILSASFSPDDRFLATGSTENTVQLWDVSGRSLRWFANQSKQVEAVVFDPHGGWLATAGNEKTVHVRNVSNGTVIRTLDAPSVVCSLAVSADGHTLAAGTLEDLLIFKIVR